MIEQHNPRPETNYAENTRYLELQKKARASFKKLFKLNGKLTE